MGETFADRLDMAVSLSELGIVSIPINALIPVSGTPFAELPPLTEDEIIRTVAVFRYLNPDAYIRMAAGRRMSAADACQYLSEVGLCAKDYINREVNASLSGGELKRIEIATVLARGTQLSVFDEPEAGIDLWSFQNLIQVFERMQEKTKDGSILIISHQERILDIADEIVVISAGQIINHGPKDEILPQLLGTSSAVNMCDKFNK